MPAGFLFPASDCLMGELVGAGLGRGWVTGPVGAGFLAAPASWGLDEGGALVPGVVGLVVGLLVVVSLCLRVALLNASAGPDS